MKLFIFDVDGPLVDLNAQANPEGIGLSAKVAKSHALAYLTGRDATWLAGNHVLNLLATAMRDSPPDWHLVAAENAGVLLSYIRRGEWIPLRNPRFPDLSDLRLEVIEKTRDITGVVFHWSKEAIITVSVDHDLGRNHPMVQSSMERVGAIFARIVSENKDRIEYQRTTNAHDIIPKGLNKTYGADYLMRQLKDPPEHVYMFGDASADLVMIEAAKQRNVPYTFYYVGDPQELPKEADPNIHVYPNLYDRAVVDILRSLS